MLVLIIDNYSSFVYNIVHTIAATGARSIVVRNDEITVTGIERIDPDRIIISPGPGTPLRRRDIGVSIEVIERLGPYTPILGICLGHQAVGVAYGAGIRRARRIMHGKTSIIEHYGDKLYAGVPRRFTAMRYHSLVLDEPLPGELIVTARSIGDGEVMGVRHRKHPVHGVQFHPESIGTPDGERILRNFLEDPY